MESGRPTSDVTRTRAGKCRMFVQTAPLTANWNRNTGKEAPTPKTEFSEVTRVIFEPVGCCPNQCLYGDVPSRSAGSADGDRYFIIFVMSSSKIGVRGSV
jgi:hypothetical protein